MKQLCAIMVICTSGVIVNHCIAEAKPLITEEKKVIQGEQKMKITDTVNIDNFTLKKIINYMMWAPPEKAINAFELMSLNTKVMFLERMNIKQYGWFLFLLSEDQWQRMWQRLPDEQKKIIPATKLAQLCLVRNSWQACSGGDILWHAGGTRDPQAKDILVYRDKALKRLHSFKTDDPNNPTMDVKEMVFFKWLDIHFQSAKLRLLGAFGAQPLP